MRVEEAVEINPFKNARVVDVACSLVESLVNGHANEAELDIVIGDDPIAVNEVHEESPEQETEVVAIPTKVLLPPQYASCPFVPEPIEDRYVVVSTLKVPSPPLVLTNPFEVRLESLAMF